MIAAAAWIERLPRALRPTSINPAVGLGGLIVLGLLLLALSAPILGTVDPTKINPGVRLSGVSAEHWFGTDVYGRDIYSRIVYGTRSSLAVGLTVAAFSAGIGLFLGLLTGYFRLVDAVLMRVMDGLMAIPTFLLAIALISLMRASILTVVIALTIPEIPRVVRLVRSVVLVVRHEPFVEAAIALGTPIPLVLTRHVFPSVVAPLVVLSTYIAASAILVEASLSFLGTGLPPELPSWGNMIADGRAFFQISPKLVFLPSAFLAVLVLGINLLGDGLRDSLDPRLIKGMQS